MAFMGNNTMGLCVLPYPFILICLSGKPKVFPGCVDSDTHSFLMKKVGRRF